MFGIATVLSAIAGAALLGGCGGDPTLECVNPDLSCTPLYEPTFANVYANTIAPKCGGDRTACHSESGRQGGLAMTSAATAYQALLDPSDPRVVPGDTACSVLLERLYTNDNSLVMPQGAPLSEAERCSVMKWVADGAIGPNGEVP